MILTKQEDQVTLNDEKKAGRSSMAGPLGAFVSLVAAALVVGGTIAPAAASHAAVLPSKPGVAGSWSAPFSEGGLFDERPPSTKEEAAMLPTAVSIAVSPDGTIIYWNGTEGYENVELSVGWRAPQEKNRTRILDLRSYLVGVATNPSWRTPRQETGIGGDLFCSDLRNLSDGRLLAVGGTEYGKGFPTEGLFTDAFGIADARIYDPEKGTWTQAEPMHHRRWYPSLISLPDGKMLVAGGVERVTWNDRAFYVNETETFDPSSGRWTENGGSGKTALPFYARLHLLPNGKVFYDSSGQMWGPWGSTADMSEWNKQKIYDPATRSWSEAGVAPLGARSGTFSAMLPLKPPYEKAEIVIGGGTLAPATPGSYVANDITELVTVKGDSVTREMGPSLNNRRWFSSGVVLPSGEVIALSGGDRDDNIFPGTTGAVRQAEMFDGHTWVPLASAGRDRLYHSSAILLGDGSILVGGHAPVYFTPFGFPHSDSLGGVFSSNFRDPSFEIFKPPYLFRGPRPRLTQVQSGIAHGETFKITTPDATKVTSVVLSRLPSVTHLADVDQRTIELEFTKTGNGTLEATIPDNRAVSLSGHYYLFLMADNGQGPTPSRAAIVQVGQTNNSQARLPFGT